MISLEGTELASIVKKQCAADASDFLSRFGRKPLLAVVLIGSNPSSRSYVFGKRKACDLVGIDHRDLFFPSEMTEPGLLELIDGLNTDDDVDGILVQLPLPKHINESKVINRILPSKDVDGFTPINMGNLLLGNPCLAPCTPKGILKMLDYYGISTDSKDVCIIGRSNIVGKPLSAMLLQKDRNATVTVCHSLTSNIRPHVAESDIVITAVGKPGIIDASMVKPGAAVIDVGITRVEDPSSPKGYHWAGDADYESVSRVCGAITPVPGGVGPMTIAMLMSNTVDAAFMRKGIKR
ncbi:MAG: bifunctional 5,10-methylenetetrahydrofolate dehydrogenase/5,10-methenyltetrahydrofolate cyclohydrolase [Sphaerochaetaceae bacterium]|jgi:methylenetetrahydrofolate dehydrogenase (NADP+)/methenyltetrahydrofolate cyclohydrolase|nr:bifunctional 5,10-methylenetetrahydrofolate dehydrogenase/5,10-methenyltetrahydrofolate cyclohydrolase [Sphaerochaetaceae bacterium]MDD3162442.1 bifunctional 5,10-methylenetetrahydrofolate dehydrogenase/5,10-methenyltetrahydrofolate cyclohydrolase [Sphaerochaetaceae bacterium]MDD4006778.1 bifunctional 5,10-methylenetetrahydrofolate dehydrogenase/5,10-methenyltetrahydrofolate cyclohydrolase [Sphaerochaetaceae bacterium]MDD4396752.1 bifunctional 5,10-methylenetetrahydrofolate dehydrogenase/5,10